MNDSKKERKKNRKKNSNKQANKVDVTTSRLMSTM